MNESIPSPKAILVCEGKPSKKQDERKFLRAMRGNTRGKRNRIKQAKKRELQNVL
jgi:hypothetical protein